MLESVSFSFQPALRDMPITIVAGSYAIALKKEKGARFTIPSEETDETNAMGRGTITPVSTRLKPSKLLGSIIKCILPCDKSVKG